MLKKIVLGAIVCAIVLVSLPLSTTAPKALQVFKMTPEPDVIVRGSTGSALTVDLSFGDADLEQWIAELKEPYPLLFLDMDWTSRFPESTRLIQEKNIPIALLGSLGERYETDSALFSQQLDAFTQLFEKKPLWFRTQDEEFPDALKKALWKQEINALGSTLRWKGGALPKHQDGEILSIALERKGSASLEDVNRLLASREFHSVEDVLFATSVKTRKIPN